MMSTSVDHWFSCKAATAALCGWCLSAGAAFAQDGAAAALLSVSDPVSAGRAACATPADAVSVFAFALDVDLATPEVVLRKALEICPAEAASLTAAAVEASPASAAAVYDVARRVLRDAPLNDVAGFAAEGLGAAGQGVSAHMVALLHAVAEAEGPDAAAAVAETLGAPSTALAHAIALADNSDGPELRSGNFIEEFDRLSLNSSTGSLRSGSSVSITLPDIGRRPSPN